MKKIAVVVIIFLLNIGIVFAREDIPERVISLGPAITESLYLLGQGQKLIGVTIYCSKPAEAKAKEKIGTVREVSVEKIISLEPDLVLATSLTDPKTVMKLRETGIKTVVFDEPKNYEQLRQQFIKLAALVGKELPAEGILRESDARIEAVRKRFDSFIKPKVFIQIGAKPLFAATGNSLLNDFIIFSGANNIALDAANGLYSREEVLKRNPAVILIVTMGIAADSEREAWQKYNSIDAVKNKRIYIIDSQKVCSPTPLGFAMALEEIVVILHPQFTGV